MAENIRERFAQPLDEFVRAFVASVEDDVALVEHDIDGSVAHVRMLGESGLVTASEVEALVAGLELVRTEWREGRLKLTDQLEDVHMNVESRLRTLAGPVADKLHTGRSRNDQVALDLRLFVRDRCRALQQAIDGLIAAFEAKSTDDLLPGTTHLQRAQPVTLRTVLGSWIAALRRDRSRVDDLLERSNVCPLGAGALAGSTLPLRPDRTAALLGFGASFGNTIDAVTDRDSALELVFVCATILTHLSQWAETWILWITPEFGYLDLPDALCTGSSLMPQKKNPDVLELVRGKAGSAIGELMSMFTTLKGLPPAYNRDLQETKPPVVRAVRTALACLEASLRCVNGAIFRTQRMALAAADPGLRATELAEVLVRRGKPFREAHAAVGRLFRHFQETGATVEGLTEAQWTEFFPDMGVAARDVLVGARR